MKQKIRFMLLAKYEQIWLRTSPNESSRFFEIENKIKALQNFSEKSNPEIYCFIYTSIDMGEKTHSDVLMPFAIK